MLPFSVSCISHHHRTNNYLYFQYSLGIAPFVDTPGLTTDEENPIGLLGFMNIRLEDGQRGKLIMVDEALYQSFKLIIN